MEVAAWGIVVIAVTWAAALVIARSIRVRGGDDNETK